MQGVDYLKYGERLLVLAMVSAGSNSPSWAVVDVGMEGKVWRSVARKPHKPSHISSWQLEPSMKALQITGWHLERSPMFCRRSEYCIV